MPSWIIVIVSFVLAFIITYSVIPSIISVSRAKHLFDNPDGRKSHTSSIPTLGGSAVFLGMMLPAVLFGDIKFDHDLKYILISMLILFFIGIKDDILIISPKKKLLAEIFAIGIVVVLGDIRVTSFFGFFGVEEVPYLISILFSVFMFVVIINGFNLIDGIDGLSSGVGILTISFLGIWFILIKDLAYAAFCFSAVGALLAFFRYNVFSKKNKIFLGDTGSLIIGLMLSIYTIRFLESNLTETLGSIYLSAPAIAIGLLIVPLMDTLRVFTLRIIKGASPFKPDRSHLHHKLLTLEFTHRESTFMILGYNIVIIILSIFLRNLGSMKVLLITLPVSLILVSVPGLIIRYRERRVLEQLNLFGNKTWIIPATLADILFSRQARVDWHHKPVGRENPNLAKMPKGQPKLKDLEPITHDTYLRYHKDSDTDQEEMVELKNE